MVNTWRFHIFECFSVQALEGDNHGCLNQARNMIPHTFVDCQKQCLALDHVCTLVIRVNVVVEASKCSPCSPLFPLVMSGNKVSPEDNIEWTGRPTLKCSIIHHAWDVMVNTWRFYIFESCSVQALKATIKVFTLLTFISFGNVFATFLLVDTWDFIFADGCSFASIERRQIKGFWIKQETWVLNTFVDCQNRCHILFNASSRWRASVPSRCVRQNRCHIV